MKAECCTQNCDSGRECPLRYHPDTKRANRCSLSAVIGASALFVIFFAMLSSLAGCERAEVKTAKVTQTVYAPALYVDAETGCEYLGLGNVYGGLTPRMGRDGKQICRAEASK